MGAAPDIAYGFGLKSNSISHCLYVSYCIISEVKLLAPLCLNQAESTQTDTHTHSQSNCCPHRNISVIRQRWIHIDPSGRAAENLLRVTATSVPLNTRVKTFHYCRLCFSPNDKIRPLWRSITSAIIPEKRGEIKCWVYCLVKINGRFLCFTVGQHAGLC